MVDAWPNTLPQKLQYDGASEGVGDGLLEYKPETGPSITRRRTTTSVRPLAGSMICSSEQISIFRAFFDTAIMGGALPFEFPDQMQDGVLLVKFEKSALPNWRPHPIGGDNFVLTLSLLVLP